MMHKTEQRMDSITLVAAKVEAETGLAWPQTRHKDLQNALRRMTRDAGFSSESQCIAWLLEPSWTSEKTDVCARHLTVPETYFFRDARAFELACDYARQKVEQAPAAGASLRVWSAGCCTGEEPYSVAISLLERVPHLRRGNISVLATDLNKSYLEHAQIGCYRSWSFRKSLTTGQKKYFSTTEHGEFRVKQHVKDLVRFAPLNLAQPVYPSLVSGTCGLDIIFCRNVLMYMSAAQAATVIERLRCCLVDGGLLFVSPSEASAEMFSGFSAIYHPDVICFRKQADGAAASGARSNPTDVLPVPRLMPAFAEISLPPYGIPEDRQPRSPTSSEHPAQRRHSVPDTASSVGRASDMARTLANQGKIDEAVAILEQVLRHSPAAASVHHALALIRMESGDREGAFRSLRKVLYLQPESIIGHYLMGVLRLADSKWHEARREFETAVRLLASLKETDIVPESDGLPAAYLAASIDAYMQKGDSCH